MADTKRSGVRWQEIDAETGRVSQTPAHRVDQEGRTDCGLQIPSKAYEVDEDEIHLRCFTCFPGAMS